MVTRFIHNSLPAKRKDQSGQVLVGVLVSMVFFMIVTVAVSEYSLNHFSSTKRTLTALDALAVAEAGADLFLYNINQNSAYTGTSETSLYSDPGLKARGTYESVAVNGTVPNEKVVTITGRMYLPNTATTPKVTRKIKLVIHGNNATPPPPPGIFNLLPDVLSGPDVSSLILNNGASILTGRVHSNGGIYVSNNARIGSISNQVPVSVSNSGGGTNPINIWNNGHIYGDVRANNQIDGSDMDNSGLISFSGVTPVVFPNYDRAAQIAAASPAVGGVSCISSAATWPANYHVSGNVNLQNCDLTVMGDVWIEGNVVANGSTIIQVGPAVSTMPVMMIDGGSTGNGGLQMNNSSALAQNAGGYGFIVVSYSNSVLSGIVFNNSSNAVGSILYCPGCGIVFNNNSGVGVRAVWGNRIAMNNAFQLTLGPPGNSVWSVSHYQQDF